MQSKKVQSFIEKVKLESTYKKFLEHDLIYLLITLFDGNCTKQSYSKKVINPLEIALQFYKSYNIDYYNKIKEGIENKKIMIDENINKSYSDTKENKSFIKLLGNDSDLYTLVHEFAHFIDRNTKPMIIPNKYWFLSETFAFYMEKQLEIWLVDTKYQDLISTRKNNRLYFENRMLKAIGNELYYERLYQEKGVIEEQYIDIEKINSITEQNIPFNIVNYLLQYPIANVLSSYLIDNNLVDNNNDFVSICLKTDLYKVLKQYTKTKRLNK